METNERSPIIPLPFPSERAAAPDFYGDDSTGTVFGAWETDQVRLIAQQDAKPTVPQVLPWANRLYEVHATGGFLHLVLDDGNLEDHFVKYCANSAAMHGDEFTMWLAVALSRMSRTQRYKIYRNNGVCLCPQENRVGHGSD